MTPSEQADLCDTFWRTKQERLQADRDAKELKTRESKLEAQLLEFMRTEGLTALGGKLVRVSIDNEPDEVPAMGDWNVFSQYVLETKDLSLVERRVSKSAVKERWEQNVEVPGIIHLPVFKLHTSQVKG